MKKIVLLSTLSAALLASFGAHAADTTELKVKGVIRPAACTPSFVGGNTVDYGMIPAKSLNQATGTVLSERTVPFSISCDAETRLAVRTTDNRLNSVVAGLAEKVPGGYGDRYAYGLGTIAGKNVGVYVLAFKQGTFKNDTTVVDTIASRDRVTWRKPELGSPDNSENASWATVGTATPGLFKNISGTLGVTVVLDKGSNLPLTQDVPLDGSATLEVVYL